MARPNFRSQLKQIQLTEPQRDLVNLIRSERIVFAHGPAGTAKTFCACYAGIQLLADKEIDQIILTKPLVEAGEKLGALPGTVDEKVEPFLRSFTHNFTRIVEANGVEGLNASQQVSFEPLAYMRGMTYEHSLMILDEAQNCDYTQLMLFLSRMGKTSKVVLLGDINQADIRDQQVVLTTFYEYVVKGLPETAHYEFDRKDIVRHPLLIAIAEKYETFKQTHGHLFKRKNQ